MGVPFLIIDGYNLLHAAGLARVRYAPGDLERARQRLLGMISEKLSPQELMRCTVVFDSKQSPAAVVSREAQHHEMRVLFAPSGYEADDLIEQLIQQHSAPRQLLVISGDHRLHKAARRRGAQPIDSDPFWERLRNRQDQRATLIPEPGSPPPRSLPPSAATAFWLREFGDVSLEELTAEVQSEDLTHPRDPWQTHLGELERTLDDPHEIERWLNDSPRKPRSQSPAD
jgi:predicted RNA-binding protein with PIN domain